MRITAAEMEASELRRRMGDVRALVIEYPDGRHRINTNPTARNATAQEVKRILGLVRMPSSYYPGTEKLPNGAYIWVFPDNVSRY